MSATRRQRQQLEAANASLLNERSRRIELEGECAKLRVENEMYKEQDKWQKQLISDLTAGGKGKGRGEEQKEQEDENTAENCSSVVEGVAVVLQKLSTSIESSSKQMMDGFDKVLNRQKGGSQEADQVKVEWATKVDKLIDILTADPTKKAIPKKVTIGKTVIGTAIDLAVGYVSNLSATQTAEYINRKGSAEPPTATVRAFATPSLQATPTSKLFSTVSSVLTSSPANLSARQTAIATVVVTLAACAYYVDIARSMISSDTGGELNGGNDNGDAVTAEVDGQVGRRM